MKKCLKEDGQAIAEVVAGLIVLAVILLSVILLTDLCRARMKVALQARAEVGAIALGGSQAGNPVWLGSGHASSRLISDVLAPAESPVAYSTYKASTYPYIQKNLVVPLYDPNGSLMSSFKVSVSEKSETVNNTEFLVRYGVGPATITVSDKVSMPVMKNFD